MPATRVQSTTDTYLQNEDTVFATGNDGTTAVKATPTVAIAKNTVFDGSAFQYVKQAVIGSITSLTGIVNVIGLGRYNATQPTLTDGDHRALQLDSNGNLKTVGIVASTYTDTQLTTPGPGAVRSFAGYRKAVVNVTIANITAGNVIIRIEGQTISGGTFRSMMPRTPGNLPVDETLTANGTYSYIIETPSDTLKVSYLSRSGTTATVDAEWRMSA